MGCYIPHSDLASPDQARGSIAHKPDGFHRLVPGDLSANLSTEFDERYAAMADFVDGEDLVDLFGHFRVREKPGNQGTRDATLEDGCGQ